MHRTNVGFRLTQIPLSFSKPMQKQGSLHYTPEHGFANGGVPLFWWKKQHVFKWLQNVAKWRSFKEPWFEKKGFWTFGDPYSFFPPATVRGVPPHRPSLVPGVRSAARPPPPSCWDRACRTSPRLPRNAVQRGKRFNGKKGEDTGVGQETGFNMGCPGGNLDDLHGSGSKNRYSTWVALVETWTM